VNNFQYSLYSLYSQALTHIIIHAYNPDMNSPRIIAVAALIFVCFFPMCKEDTRANEQISTTETALFTDQDKEDFEEAESLSNWKIAGIPERALQVMQS